MKYKILFIALGLFILSNQFVLSDGQIVLPYAVRVINNTDYTVAIDDVESKSQGKWVIWRIRKVWDLGPYEKGTHTDSLIADQNYIIGIEGQTEGHVIIIDKNGNRSDYDQGKIKMDPNDPEGTIIDFDSHYFPVTISVKYIEQEGFILGMGEEPGEAFIAPSETTYPFFTITIDVTEEII